MESLSYFALPVQTNAYGLSCLYADDCNKVLVATLQRQVFCIEFRKGHEPNCKEVQFTYIPSDAEIISLDTFKRSNTQYDFVVGITFAKPGSSPMEASGETRTNAVEEKYYFNIYASWSPLSEFNIDYIAQGCLTLEIDFVPYHLYHTHMCTNKTNEEYVWLLSGSDTKIHCYRENKDRQCFYEEPIEKHFPEFCNFGAIVLWMEVHHTKEMTEEEARRWSVVGCENGFVRVCEVKYDIVEKLYKVLQTFESEFDNPITSVRLFHHKTVFQTPDSVAMNLLVINSLEGSTVFQDISKNGLNAAFDLPDSKRVDCSIASCVCDVNFDGVNEVIVGTFGRELLTYKYNEGEQCYSLISNQLMCRPIQSLAYMDMTGDGLKELLVLTNKGLHVLQHNLVEASAIIKKRISDKLYDLRGENRSTKVND